MTRGSSAFRGLVAVMLFLLAVEVNLRLERTVERAPVRHSLYIPSGQYLRFASLGFNHLLADALYVWSIQYYSDQRAERWAYLSRLYDAITDLDRRFLVAYSVGALILSMEAHDPESAMTLLDKGIRMNPETFALAWEAAFWARGERQLRRASEYLEIAMTKPDAPPYVARWYAHTVDRLGTTSEALELWRGILAKTTSKYERAVAERWVHDLSLERTLAVARQQIEAFTAREGRLPVALEELARSGAERAPLTDAEGHRFNYDRKTGEVTPSCGFFLRARLKPAYRAQ